MGTCMSPPLQYKFHVVLLIEIQLCPKPHDLNLLKIEHERCMCDAKSDS